MNSIKTNLSQISYHMIKPEQVQDPSTVLVVYFLEPKQVVKVKESTMMVDTIKGTVIILRS